MGARTKLGFISSQLNEKEVPQYLKSLQSVELQIV
jgi:hypothetical protein